MKSISCVLVAFAFAAIQYDASAQARNLTRRVVNPDNTLKTPNNPTPPSPSPPAQVQPRPATPSTAQTVTNVVPEKTKEQKEAILRKTIDFQKKKAEEGAPSAQYDLGMRYLNGDGVEKNSELAQKWLQAASTNGNTQATKKLEELRKKQTLVR